MNKKSHQQKQYILFDGVISCVFQSETKVAQTGVDAMADILAIALIAVGFVLLCFSRKRKVTE